MVTAVQATQPSNFTPSMTVESCSDRAIFTTTYTDGQYLSRVDPILYPPDQVWCVLLKDDRQQQLVFVGLHNGFYQTDWIVRIPPDPWGSSALQSILSTIGCSLD
jgi:hypothetical protein